METEESQESDEVLVIADDQNAEDIEPTRCIVWNYYKIDGVQSKKGGAKNVVCTFCDTAFTGCSSSRAFAHILGRAVLGQKRANIGACTPIRKDNDNRYDQFKNAQKALNKEIMSKESLLATSRKKQTVLDLTSPAKRLASGEIKIVESKMLDATIASFFYENALSFNVADSPSLAAVIDQCIEFGQQHPGRRYKAPNRRRISGPLLDSAFEATTLQAQPIIDRAKKYGGTLASDGWSNVQRRPITNFMLVTRESAIFLKSVDSTDHMADGGRKNATYLAEQINIVIREIGAENIVQVIMDGANKACWPIINSEFPHIICAWCTAHVMDLLLEDIGKMEFFKEIWAQGKSVVIWIRGHQAFAAKFSKMASKSLLLPGDVNVSLLSWVLLKCPFARRYPLRHCVYHAIQRNRASRRNCAIAS